MPEGPPNGRPPPAKPDAYVTAYGRLALACSALAVVSQVVNLELRSRALSAHARGLPPPEGLQHHLWGALALAGLVAFIPGWYFIVCGYLAHGPFGAWRVGCTALVLLIAATMFSCLQV